MEIDRKREFDGFVYDHEVNKENAVTQVFQKADQCRQCQALTTSLENDAVRF